MPFDELASLERQLKNKRDNLLLLQERMSRYALDTDIPLELVREEREHQTEIASLEARIAQLKAAQGAQVYPTRKGFTLPAWIWLPVLGVILAFAGIATLWMNMNTAKPNPTLIAATQTASTQVPATATVAAIPAVATVTPTPTEIILSPYPYPSGRTPEGASPEAPAANEETAIPTLPPNLTVAELEPMLAEVNIGLASSGSEADLAAMRSYFEGPDSAYYILSVACLQLLRGNHLVQTVYLDMIDDYYTRLRGGESNYLTAEGTIDEETLSRAIVAAYNNYYGENAASFDELIVPGPNP